LPYRPINILEGVPPVLEDVVKTVIDPVLADLHHLLVIRYPDQGPKGSMQRAQAIVLLAAIDGAAQLLHPGEMSIGSRFKGFLKRRFPWSSCPADGLSTDQACALLWDEARCPLLHRFGAKHQSLVRVKLGNVFNLSDSSLEAIESSAERPHSSPAIERNSERTVIWIENIYWGLRKAIEAAVSDPMNAHAAETWIIEGHFDPKHR
jgi:hypothetical protein